MANSADDPMPVRCPHCGSLDAMEYPSVGEHESFFCRDCRGFKLLRVHRDSFAVATQRIGRLHLASTGDRWLLPD